MASIEPGVPIPEGPLPPEAAPTCDDAIVVSLYPEICALGGTLFAQDLVAYESADVAHSPDVNILGVPASHHGALLSHVIPGGAGEGIISGCMGGCAYPLDDTSPTVLVDGQPCVRHDTLFGMNCAGPGEPPNTLGRMVYDHNLVRSGVADLLNTPTWYATEGPNGMCVPFSAVLDEIEIPQPTLGESIVGSFRGAATAGWEIAEGAFYGAADLAQYSTDYVLGGPFDLLGVEAEWLPSASRARETEQAFGEMLGAVVDDPSLLWDEQVAEVQRLWNAGQYSEAMSYGGVHVVGLFLGGRGVNRLATLERLPPPMWQQLLEAGVINADEAAMLRQRVLQPGEIDLLEAGDGVTIRGHAPDLDEAYLEELFDELGDLRVLDGDSDWLAGNILDRLPDGISPEAFDDLSALLRDGAGHLSDDIAIQGSRAAGASHLGSDLDVAVIVTPEEYNAIVGQAFRNVNPATARERTMLRAMITGRLQQGEAGLSGLSGQLAEQLGMPVQISVIRQGSSFDTGPYIPIGR